MGAAVVITGASGGIGAACVSRLTQCGFTVLAAVRNDAPASSVASGAIPFHLDLSNSTAIERADVFFRAFVAGQAGELGLTGYVRNLREGSVEVNAEGERENLQQLISRLEVGPPAASVEKVATEWSEYTGNYSAFNIKYQY